MLGDRKIIISNHSYIFRDAAPVFPDHVHGRDRHQVAVDKDRIQVRGIRKQLLHRHGAGGVGKISVANQRRINSLFGGKQSALISFKAMLDFQLLLRAAEEGDPFFAQADQVLGGDPCRRSGYLRLPSSNSHLSAEPPR